MKKFASHYRLVVIGLTALFGLGWWQGAQVHAADDKKPFMVYYRAWRDSAMHMVNTDILDRNPQSMLDLPAGIDIINVFSHVPKGQEVQAQPFFDQLKAKYVPAMHARGAKLVRALDYTSMVNNLKDVHEDTPTDEDVDKYAAKLVDELSDDWDLDGIDIDMETYPTDEEAALSDRIIRAMSKRIGPKAKNGTLFIYDTNGQNLKPFQNVMDCFSFLGYQQYGSGPERTEKMKEHYTAAGYPASQLLTGLTFPEEGDPVNRWYDTNPENFLKSNMHTVANYVQANLGGMFVYAVDRDGRTYEEPDFSHILPTTYRWTKTAILESKGYSLPEIKAAAYRYLDDLKLTRAKVSKQELAGQIKAATNAFEVNSVFLADDHSQALAPTFDAVAEIEQPVVNKAKLTALIQQANTVLAELRDSAARKGLKQAITAATQMVESDTVGQTSVDAAVKRLGQAMLTAQKRQDQVDYQAGYATGKATGQAGKPAAANPAGSAKYQQGYAAGYRAGHALWIAGQHEDQQVQPEQTTPAKPVEKAEEQAEDHAALPGTGERVMSLMLAGLAVIGCSGYGIWRRLKVTARR